MARSLVERYGFERGQLRRDWFLRTRIVNAYGNWENFHRKVQLTVVSGPEADGDPCDVIRACVVKPRSVKPDDEREGVFLLEEILGALPNCEYGLWTNGRDRICRRKIAEGRIEPAYEAIDDLPAHDGQQPAEPLPPRASRVRRKTTRRSAPKSTRRKAPGLLERFSTWLAGLGSNRTSKPRKN